MNLYFYRACLKKPVFKKIQPWVVSHLQVTQQPFVRPCALIFGMENAVTIITTQTEERAFKIQCGRGVRVR